MLQHQIAIRFVTLSGHVFCHLCVRHQFPVGISRPWCSRERWIDRGVIAATQRMMRRLWQRSARRLLVLQTLLKTWTTTRPQRGLWLSSGLAAAASGELLCPNLA